MLSVASTVTPPLSATSQGGQNRKAAHTRLKYTDGQISVSHNNRHGPQLNRRTSALGIISAPLDAQTQTQSIKLNKARGVFLIVGALIVLEGDHVGIIERVN